MKKPLLLLWPAILALALSSCLDTKPKVLGKIRLNLLDNDTATPDTFKFNFGFRDTTAAAPLNKIVYLQGSANTKSTMISTCNSAGTNCVCEFYDTNGDLLETTDTDEISYDVTGNYFRCEFDGSFAGLATVKIRNQGNTVTSTSYTVDTTLTGQKIVGDDLDVNKLRTIYRYECLFNFLQKMGTSTTSFDCSNQGSQCWNSGGSSGDFCLLQTNFPFHLFQDTYSSNVESKPVDQLYSVAGSSVMCGLQIKQFDCAGTSGALVPIFGLFADQTGIFDSPITLKPAPSLSTSTYGFAAKTSTVDIGGTATTVCPPGMVRRVFYRTTTSNTGLGVDSNYTSGEIISEVGVPATTPTSLSVGKLEGGDCNGTACTLPGTAAATVTSFAYSSTGETEFCVVPPALL